MKLSSFVVKLLTDVIVTVHTRSSAVLIGFEQIKSSHEVNVPFSSKKIYYSLFNSIRQKRPPVHWTTR